MQKSMRNLMILAGVMMLVTAGATAAPYDTELLADGSFEVWDANNPAWVYYWNVNAGAHSVGSEDFALDGSRSVKIFTDWSNWNEEGFTLNGSRNVINTGLDIAAGDTVEMSMMVYIPGAWNGNGVGMRLVNNGGVAVTSSFTNDTGGGWQEVTLSYTYDQAVTNETLDFQVRFHSNDTSLYDDVAYVDSASMIVTPEPASMSLLGLGGLALLRRRRK